MSKVTGRSWILPLLLIAMLVLAACGGGGDDAEAPAAEAPAAEAPAAGSAQEVIARTLTVAAGDLFFGETPDNVENPPVWTVTAGETVDITLENKGALQHNWAIVKLGEEVPVPFMPETNSDLLLWDTGPVEPGQTGSGRFIISDPGEYSVICTVAGHYPAMQGKLVVQ